MEYVTLSNGLKMPILGFGVFQNPPEQTKESVLIALKNGYRLIDTARAYKNEKEVGEAVRESGIPREEVFITTKLWVSDFSYEKALAATEQSLKALGVDYIDLLLLHQPLGDYIGAWRALEKLYKDGKLKSIGVSNCYPHVIADLCETFEIKPMVNQVEIHPFFQQQLNVDTMKSYGVIPEAWGPFNEGKNNFFKNPVLTEIGKKYGKSAAQVALRWNIQRGVVVIPKSVHEDRIKQNIDVFDFKLSDEDMKKIATLDTGRSEIVDHFSPDFVKFLHSFSI